MSGTPFGRVVDLVAGKPSADLPFRLGLEDVQSGTGRLVGGADGDYEGSGTHFQAGDVLFGKLRPYLAKVWLSDREGEAVGDFHVYRPVPERCDAGFLSWFVLSRAFLDPVSASVFGAKMPRADWKFIRTLSFPCFSLPGQRAIADYLDRETAQIDTLIAEQQRLIELLQERREALREGAFAPAGDHRVTTVKRVLLKLNRPAPKGLGVVTAYRDGAVTLRSNRREEGYTFATSEEGYQEIQPGDVVFHALDGFAGAVGVSDSHGVATPVYHVCTPVSGDDPHYIAQLLRFLGTSGFLETQAPSTRQRSVDFRNWSTFGRIALSLPPAAVQRKIVHDLSEKLAKIDTLIAEAERFIELAKERRSALITAAVTGQIDIPGVE